MKHYCTIGAKLVVMFDDETKRFGVFAKSHAKTEDLSQTDLVHSPLGAEPIERVTTEEEARDATDGLSITKCGKCGKLGHGWRQHRKPYTVRCDDCGWEGTTDLVFVDATCPEGHIHLTRVA